MSTATQSTIARFAKAPDECLEITNDPCTCRGTNAVALVPRWRRRERAAAAERMAARMGVRAEEHGRVSAELRGASSRTHTHGLLAAYRRGLGHALLCYADALRRVR